MFSLPGQSLGAGLSERVGELAAELPLAAVFGLRTAAWLHGLDVLPRSVSNDCWPVEVVVPKGVELASRRGLRVYRWGLGTDVEQIGDVLVTTKARTALDCARVLPRLDAVSAVDQFLRGGLELAELRRRAAIVGDRGSARLMGAVLDVADTRAESPLESWARCLIVDAGLPRPVAQLPVGLRDGSIVHLDLGYRRFRVGIECNGLRYHATDDMREHDRQRRKRLESEGWLMFTLYGSDVVVSPDDMLAEIRWRLRHRGWKPSELQLERVEKRVRYLAMALRLEREDWNAAWGLGLSRRMPRSRYITSTG
ncbi:hypothetical protein Snas_2486 [Stackebrandtia nassauensis DSM 44728]|uniref:Restriction endonuclease type II-like domain-containing protein n=2 Tax=Stackebrandtia TaxID=283810 RepID=D3Q4Y9_STANL|nr:hypothetical protein Snas_2486 [Stackebrandtia nassauensis DSM 44728]